MLGAGIDMTFRTTRPYLVAVAVLLMLYLGITYFYGPFDSIPRLHASAQSPDGAFTVKVYRKRVSHPPAPRIDVIAKVFDQQSNLIYEKKIYDEGSWSELDNLFRNITFENDEIRIGPKFSPDEYVVIRKLDLKAAQ
jgi:hypothetical protein